LIEAGGRSLERATHYLLSTYQPQIRQFVLRNGGSAEEAEEILLETILETIRNISQGRYQPDKPIAAYMRTIYGRKLIQTVYRKGKVEKNTVFAIHNQEDSDIQEQWDTLSKDEDPFAFLYEQELKDKIDQAIAQLKPKCKRLIALVFLQNNMSEIGETMIAEGHMEKGSNPQDAAKNQYKRCKEFLKTVIETQYKELIDYYKN
jgi:RNA polymerase sigma factor (sigma-70 family)